MKFRIGLCLYTLIFLTGYSCAENDNGNNVEFVKSIKIDSSRITSALTEISKTPHPFGSARQVELSNFIKDNLNSDFYSTTLHEFSSETPNPKLTDQSLMFSPTITKKGLNILAIPRVIKKDCLYLIGSHYDSKLIDGKTILGANDSGSSSAALIELSHIIANETRFQNLKCHLALIWFDGEEAVLKNWNDGLYHPAKIIDNTYGSRDFAASLKKCSKDEYCLSHEKSELRIVNFYLLDMIGGSNIIYSNDQNSDQNLRKLFFDSITKLGFSKNISQYSKDIRDDHIPFVNLKIPSLNIIGFEDLAHWHVETDTVSNVSIDSIESSLRILLLTLLESDHNSN